jgi:AraC family transcriptional regulator, regulatory protein of adaptative response / DNA-3-methyladenine glycosylase II
MDVDTLHRIAESRDARFDGRVYLAITSTGIYCRPSCPAMAAKREHVRFYRTAAAAQRGGFRACKRCRPDAAPGSPEWNLRADAVGRAMRLIQDGVLDREGVGGVAARIGYSERHLTRIVTDELGAPPIAIARAQRAQTARTLIETTRMPFTDVAFAAGFQSIRQFNDTIQEVFALTPTALRARVRPQPIPGGTITLRLPARAPIAWEPLLSFLGDRAVAGVEEIVGDRYRRVLDLANGAAIADVAQRDGAITCALRLDDVRDLAQAVATLRRLLDLDADPVAVDTDLAADAALAPLVAARPGLRVPGAAAPPELAARAVLGQQVSVAGARTLAGRLVAAYGRPLDHPDGTLTHCFPTADALAGAVDGDLAMPVRRRETLRTLMAHLAEGRIDLGPGADRTAARAALVALPGIGPWTAEYVAMRALNDPDAWPASDLGVRHALGRLGLDHAAAERWRPWRSYATFHLWSSL